MMLDAGSVSTYLVRLLGEDGVVGLEVVLLQHLLAVADRHVEQRVADGNEVVLSGHLGLKGEYAKRV